MPEIDDFHARRIKSLGASETAKVMGVSPFGNILDVYNYKVGISTGGVIFQTEAMNRGNRHELFVISEFSAKHGMDVRNHQLAVNHGEPSLSWASATLDGVAYKGFLAVGPVEAKTITTSLYITPPIHYIIQVLWQCWVTGFVEGWLAVWSTKDARYHDYHIKVEDYSDLLQECIEVCTKFWYENVLKRIPPDFEPRKQRSDCDFLPDSKIKRYLEVDLQIKTLNAEKSNLKTQIIEDLGSPSDLHVENDLYKVDVSTVPCNRSTKNRLVLKYPELESEFKENPCSVRLSISRTGVIL